ncbi:MAG: NAD-dependent epimerase/dehydratase family protein, partial [Anaerolineae bacterium]|nr:NAD-dependent epimerase/dehydratase family protein [Anaerolineae bacterium]
MNILITGDISSIAASLAIRLSQNKQKVVVAGANFPDLKLRDVIYHPVLSSDELYSEIISAYRFDAVVFLSTREELLFNSSAQYSGKILDGLINTLNLCRDGNVKHLFFVSSTEVNGESTRSVIDTCPDPVSVNGITLQSEEAQCKYYTDYFGLGTT